MNSLDSTAKWPDPRKGKGTTVEPHLVLKRRAEVVRFPTGHPFSINEEQEPLGEMCPQSAQIAATA